MRSVLRPLFIGFFAALIALAVPASTAGATTWLWTSGPSYYWIGTDGGGTIWCARSQAKFGKGNAYHGIAAYTATWAKRDIYCANNANAPAGYVEAWVDVFLDAPPYFPLCVNLASATNASGTNVATISVDQTDCGDGCYVSGHVHKAALDFAWRELYQFSDTKCWAWV